MAVRTTGAQKSTTLETPRSLNGANAVAQAMRQTNPHVVAAYPITPSTMIVETFSQFVANGEVDTEFVAVESEHSAMSACIGAAAAGGRVQTVTSSQGLALMWEMLYIAAGMRLPIVLHTTNRALSAPLNIHCDHSDTMGARDSGWIQLYAEDAQEAYDNALMSVRIAEDPEVNLPVMHSQDGYTVSHSTERVLLLPDDVAQGFLGQYRPPSHPLLDTAHPISLGAMFSPQYLFELKHQQEVAMGAAEGVIMRVGQEFARLSGRYRGLTEGYRLEDAAYVLVGIGSTIGTARVVVDQLREEGVKAGLLKIRSYRPFPEDDVMAALAGRKAVAVLDRALAYGSSGNPLYSDLCTTLFKRGTLQKVVGYAYGIGGRDLVPAQIRRVFSDLMEVAEGETEAAPIRYLGLRE